VPQIYKYEMKALPTSYVIQPGHRIRVDLAGGSIAAEGQPGPQGPGLNPNESSMTIYQEKRHSSYIELPIIGTGWKYIEN
jgi:predicted acyl esterase